MFVLITSFVQQALKKWKSESPERLALQVLRAAESSRCFSKTIWKSDQRCATRLPASFAAETMVSTNRFGRGQGRAMGCTVTHNACLMKSKGGKFGTNLSKMLPRGCFPEKADTKGKRGTFLLFKTDGSTGSTIPAFKHDVDSREGVIMLSRAGKTGASSRNSDVCQ